MDTFVRVTQEYEAMTPEQKQVVNYMLGAAIEKTERYKNALRGIVDARQHLNGELQVAIGYADRLLKEED